MASYRIGIVGGTGAQGKGLAHRFALAGHEITLGSRSRQRAADVSAEVTAHAGVDVTGTTNAEAARNADVVVLAVPYDGHADLVRDLADALVDRVVVSCVNPIGFDPTGPYALSVPDGSAAQEGARQAPRARWAAAFHHVSAVSLWRHEGPLTGEDVLVCGDDAGAKEVAIEIATAVTGRPGVDAGALRLAGELEALTAVLISVNKRYQARAGVRLTGLPER